MWNEPPVTSAGSTLNTRSASKQPLPAVVQAVQAESIGEALGFQPGDRLISINGVRPRDLIDYRFLTVEEELDLEVIDSQGKIHKVNLEKDAEDGLGLTFT